MDATVVELIGRSCDGPELAQGVKALPRRPVKRSESCGAQIVIGGDAAKKLNLKEGDRVSIAVLSDGKFALAASPCGWAVSKLRDAPTLRVQMGGQIRCTKPVEAVLERGMYTFPADAFVVKKRRDGYGIE